MVSELYNRVDTIFVGNYVNANGIGALAVVFPIQRLIIALSVMIGIGTSTAFTRARGAEDEFKIRKTIRKGFTLVFIVMIPLIILIYFFATPILNGLGASGEILSYGVEYLSIIIFGSIFLSLTIFTSNVMISLGKSNIAIISTSIGAVLNIIFDYVLVKHFKMGVTGAAIATTISQFTGFLFSYYNLSKLKKALNIKFGFEFNKTIVISILFVGISAFIVEAEDGILLAVLNNLLRYFSGNQAIIVLAVTTKVYMFLFVTLFGISSAMQPIAAYNVGAKNYKRLKRVLKDTLIFATLTTTVLWAVFMMFAPHIMGIFVADPIIIAEAVVAFRIMILFFPLVSVYYISIFYFQSLGKAKHSIVMSVLRQVVIMIPLAIVLVRYFNMGAMGVWLSFPIADVIVSVIAIVTMLVENKKVKMLIFKNQVKSEPS